MSVHVKLLALNCQRSITVFSNCSASFLFSHSKLNRHPPVLKLTDCFANNVFYQCPFKIYLLLVNSLLAAFRWETVGRPSGQADLWSFGPLSAGSATNPTRPHSHIRSRMGHHSATRCASLVGTLPAARHRSRCRAEAGTDSRLADLCQRARLTPQPSDVTTAVASRSVQRGGVERMHSRVAGAGDRHAD